MDMGSSADSQRMYEGDEMTALQKHCAFFDRNKDGVIYPWETYQGCRAIGCNILLSAALVVGVHLGLSEITRPGKLPDLRFPVVIQNIKLGKHGSDTDVYDRDGRFVRSKFENIFKKHARTRHDAITWTELEEMMKANRDAMDYVGWFASFGEWKLLYFLCKDEEGEYLKKDTVRAVYDGSLFEKMEKEKSSSTKHP